MGKEMVALVYLIVLLCISSLEAEAWNIIRTSVPLHAIYSKPLRVGNLDFAAHTGNIAQANYIPYNPFIVQDQSKIVPKNMDPPVRNDKNLFHDPGAEVGFTIVIPRNMLIFLNKLFSKTYRDVVLSFLNKYPLGEIFTLYAQVNFPYTLTDRQIQVLKIFKQYSRQQTYVHYDILGKERLIMKYLNELMTEFDQFLHGYPMDPYSPSGDGKPDYLADIWQFPPLSNYPQDFMFFVQKHPSIFVFDSPNRQQSLMTISNDILKVLDISQLVGNPMEQQKYPPDLLDVLLKLYRVPSDQQIIILYHFLSNLRSPELLMRYIYILFSLSKKQNKVPSVDPEFVIVPKDREKMIKNVIFDLLANLDMALILNNPNEQEKYSPELMSILIKVYNSGSKQDQYAILYDFLNNQNDPKVLLDLITKLYGIIRKKPEKKEDIIVVPTEKTPPPDPFDGKNVIIKEIYAMVKTLDISNLFRNPTKQKSFPPELLGILFKIQDYKNENEKYNALYDFLIKQKDPNILFEYLKILYMYLLDTQIKPPVSGDVVYKPPLDSELIVTVINNIMNNQNILDLVFDSNIQQKYPTELFNILLKLQNIRDKKQQFKILYDFLLNQKDQIVLLEYLHLLIELANNTHTKPDGILLPKINIEKVIFNLIRNPNMTSVITDPIEQIKYPPELLNVLIEINKIGDAKRQFDILYGFLMKQNDLNLLMKYVYLLLGLSGGLDNIKDLDLPIQTKCSPDTMGQHECMDCVCSNNDMLTCVIKQNCQQTPNVTEEPVLMQCKPYSKFQLDECSTCECNKDGVPICILSECNSTIDIVKPIECRPYSKYHLDECNACECNKDGVIFCSASSCSSQEKLDIAFSVLTLVNDDGLVCPAEQAVPHCAPGTEWVDKCYECTCNSFGRRSCARMPGCDFRPLDNITA